VDEVIAAVEEESPPGSAGNNEDSAGKHENNIKCHMKCIFSPAPWQNNNNIHHYGGFLY
jgi:hypothetical protein